MKAAAGVNEQHRALGVCKNDFLTFVHTPVNIFILDPIDSYLDEGLSEDRGQHVRPLLEAAAWIAKETGAAVVATRHPGKDRIRVTGRLSLAAVASEIAGLDVYLFPMSTGANTRSGTLPVALGTVRTPVLAMVKE